MLKPINYTLQRVGLKQSNHCDLVVILPTYNERKNLSLVVDGINKALNEYVEYMIVVVDDNSPDGTGIVADRLSYSNENIVVVHRSAKLGLTSAVMAGMEFSDSPVVGVMDADLQHSPNLLKNMLDEIANGNDLVIASRYIRGGYIDGWNPIRMIVSKCAALITHVILPETKTVKDPLSGYFMFKRRIISEEHLSGKSWKILLEILSKGNPKQVVEVPFTFRPRVNGESKLKLKVYLDYLSLLFRLKRCKKAGVY